jgi:hypothetical protein
LSFEGHRLPDAQFRKANKVEALFMSGKVFRLVLIGFAASTPLAAIGCTSSDSKPYELSSQSTVSDSESVQRLRWTDDKGHYRADLRMLGGPPLRSAKE